MKKERAIKIVEELDELSKFCVITQDRTSYQICSLLKEIVMDTISEER